MGFSDWISSLLGSKNNEKNKGSEDSIETDVSDNVKNVHDVDIHAKDETHDAVYNDEQIHDESEIAVPKIKERETAETAAQQDA